MAARDTYATSVQSATKTQVATVIAADTTFQEAVNAAGINSGSNIQKGAGATMIASVAAANTARFLSRQAAEHAKQVAIQVARDTLRAAGDFGPA